MGMHMGTYPQGQEPDTMSKLDMTSFVILLLLATALFSDLILERVV